MHHVSFYRTVPITVLLSLLLTLAGCGEGGEERPAAPEAETPAAEAPETGDAETEATISGTIRFAGEVPRPEPIQMDADPACLDKHDGPVYPNTVARGEEETLANVLVRLVDGVPGHDYPAPTEPAVIDQRGCRYTPHVTGVMLGQPLKFLNSDGILHNVRLLAENNPEDNIAMLGTVKERVVTFEEPEVMVEAVCDVHPWMQAYIAVMPHPYFAVTGEDGRFEIPVPAGEYTLEAGHETLGTQHADVRVRAGETAKVELTFESSDG